jgi:hypothetical protein
MALPLVGADQPGDLILLLFVRFMLCAFDGDSHEQTPMQIAALIMTYCNDDRGKYFTAATSSCRLRLRC